MISFIVKNANSMRDANIIAEAKYRLELSQVSRPIPNATKLIKYRVKNIKTVKMNFFILLSKFIIKLTKIMRAKGIIIFL